MRTGLSRVVSLLEMKSGKRRGVATLERLNREATKVAEREARLASELVSPLGIIKG